jgi:inner membrane transporter RhtA
VAVEFLGPLTVAAVRSHNKQALLWPLLALLGVVLLTEPWQGTIDPAGVRFAAGSAVGWGAYIELTQRVGDRFTGIQGLALTVPIAAVATAVVASPRPPGT